MAPQEYPPPNTASPTKSPGFTLLRFSDKEMAQLGLPVFPRCSMFIKKRSSGISVCLAMVFMIRRFA